LTTKVEYPPAIDPSAPNDPPGAFQGDDKFCAAAMGVGWADKPVGPPLIGERDPFRSFE